MDAITHNEQTPQSHPPPSESTISKTDAPPLTNGSAPDAPTETPSVAPSMPEPPTTNGAPAPTAPTTNGHSTPQTTPRQTPPLPFPTLAGKVALVTGASRGIGAGIALELGLRGASVVINYHKDHAGARSIVSQIESAGSSAFAIQADVSKVSEITRLFEETLAHFGGRLDIVCSNSGMESFDEIGEITEERFDAVMGLNFRAQFFVAQAAYKYITSSPIIPPPPSSSLASNPPAPSPEQSFNTGRLILMSSIAAGLLSVPHHALYSSSKSAINGLVPALALDYGRGKGITVNAIAPGGVKSDMFAQVAWKYIPGADASWGAEKVEAAMAGNCPLGRCALPRDVGRVVGFLAGEEGGWVNGQVITISGGSGQ